MTFTEIIANGAAVVSAVGSTYTELNQNFEGILQIPVALVITRALVSILKSILMYRRGGRR